MRAICLMAFAVSACSAVNPLPCPQTAVGDIVYVVGQGWHAEIGIPIEELGKDLAFYREVFPGARVIMFGYGKKTFFTSPPETISEYILGPIPGPAVIQTVGIRVTPVEAYPEATTITLALSPEGRQALTAYIWEDLVKNSSGEPQAVGRSTDPDGLFYAAGSEYNLFHTCNTWTAKALHTAGLPISGEGVILSGQVMARVSEAADSQCNILP